MFVRVICAGVPIGTARFEPPAGLAHAALVPLPGHAFPAAAARVLGRQLAGTVLWSAEDADFADEVAARWTGGRLALEDLTGHPLGVTSVVVIEAPPGSPPGTPSRVVADFRPAGAGSLAHRRRDPSGGGDRTRPAA